HGVNPRMKHGVAPCAEHQPLTRFCSSSLGGVATVLQQVVMQVNFHRANAGASAAKRGRIGQMFELLDAIQMRRQYAADRSGIGRAVSVSSDVAEDGADVQAGTTANAVQHFALFRVGEQLASSVVYEDHVE